MESHEIWMRFAAGQTPAEFMCQYQSRNPRRCAERYVSRLPGFYGLLRQRTWRDTFSQAAPPTREQVIGGLTAYLEETRAEWEAALAEKTEREQADWEAAERERTEREQAEWERAQQAHVDQALELANAALPSEEMPPPVELSPEELEREEWERALNIRVEPLPANPPAETAVSMAKPAVSEAPPEPADAPEPTGAPNDAPADTSDAEQTTTPGTAS